MQNISEFYTYLLDLELPWKVESVTAETSMDRVTVHIGHQEPVQFSCPRCRALCSVHGHSLEKVWRHLSSCGKETHLRAALPVVECSVHGRQEIRPPWEASSPEVTVGFERYLKGLAGELNDPRKVSRLAGIEPVLVRRILRRAKTECAPCGEPVEDLPAGASPGRTSSSPRQLSLFHQNDMSFVNQGLAALKALELEEALELFRRHQSAFPKGYDVAPPMAAARYLLAGFNDAPVLAPERPEYLCGLWDGYEKEIAAGSLSRLSFQAELKGAFFTRLIGEFEAGALSGCSFLPGGMPTGWLYLQAGRVDEAIRRLQTSIAEIPHRADLYGYLGDAYWLRGDVTVARRCYREACLIDPGGIDWTRMPDEDLKDLKADLLSEYHGDARLVLEWLPSHARIEGLFEPRVVRVHDGLKELVEEYRAIEKELSRREDPMGYARLFFRGMILCENADNLRFVKTIDLIQVRRAMKAANRDLFEEFLQRIVGGKGPCC
jgi:tetratricopeptide (TPR) repeat protein